MERKNVVKLVVKTSRRDRIGTRLAGRTRTAETVCQTVPATRVPRSRRVDIIIIGDRG